MFHNFNVAIEIILVVLSIGGICASLFLFKAYWRRQLSYQARVQTRLTKIGNGALSQGEEKVH